jgi:hypothetical protein
MGLAAVLALLWQRGLPGSAPGLARTHVEGLFGLGTGVGASGRIDARGRLVFTPPSAGNEKQHEEGNEERNSAYVYRGFVLHLTLPTARG